MSSSSESLSESELESSSDELTSPAQNNKSSKKKEQLKKLAKSFFLDEAEEESDSDFEGDDQADLAEEGHDFYDTNDGFIDDEEIDDGPSYYSMFATESKMERKFQRQLRREERATRRKEKLEARKKRKEHMRTQGSRDMHLHVSRSVQPLKSSSVSRLSSLAYTSERAPSRHRSRSLSPTHAPSLKRQKEIAKRPAPTGISALIATRTASHKPQAKSLLKKPLASASNRKPDSKESPLSLAKDWRTLNRRFKESNYGRVPDFARAIACLRQMERYRPSRNDLVASMELIVTLKKYKKKAKDKRVRWYCNRLYAYWKALASGKQNVTLAPIPQRKANNIRTKSTSGSRNQLRPGIGKGGSQQRARSASPRPKQSIPRIGLSNVKALRQPARLASINKGGHAHTRPGSHKVMKLKESASKPKAIASTPPKKSGLARSLSGQSKKEFRHQWPGIQKRLQAAITATPPNLAIAAQELKLMSNAKPTPSMLSDAVKGGLIADIKAYRQHADKRISQLSTEVFTKFKTIMKQQFIH